MPDNVDPMVALLANRQAHPPTPGGPQGPSARPGAAVAPMPPMGGPPGLGGAVPVKDPKDSLIEQLLQLLGLGNMMGGGGGMPPGGPASGPDAAQGIVDAAGKVMSPVKHGMDWLQNLGK